MNKLIIFWTTTILLISFNFLVGQTDTLNKFTDKGKKTGYWKVLLNDNANPVDSIASAFFYGLELYDNGERVFKFHKHEWTGGKMKFDGVVPTKGKPEAINGTFKWFDNKGFLQILETYKDGQPLYIKSYHVLNNKTDTIDHLFEDLDFTVKYDNIPGTYYYREHALYDGTCREYWFRKGKKGWRVYKIKK
jgi:hypothetical protein